MDDSAYFPTYEDLMKRQEEVKPEWRDFAEPVYLRAENEAFAFIMGCILM